MNEWMFGWCCVSKTFVSGWEETCHLTLQQNVSREHCHPLNNMTLNPMGWPSSSQYFVEGNLSYPRVVMPQWLVAFCVT